MGEIFHTELEVKTHDPQVQLIETLPKVHQYILDKIKVIGPLKMNVVIKVVFQREKDGEITTESTRFISPSKRIVNENEISEVLLVANNKLLNQITDWISNGSGWTIKSIKKHKIQLVKWKPLRGSSYLPLPKVLQSKKAF